MGEIQSTHDSDNVEHAGYQSEAAFRGTLKKTFNIPCPLITRKMGYRN
jgi:hypothetical protein